MTIDKKKPLAWHLLAEERIRSAQAAGEFDKLPGFGQPIQGIDEPHDEDWWIKEKLKREQLAVLPPALELRLDVERTLARIALMANEDEVRQEIGSLNERIRKQSFAACTGPSIDVMPLEIDEVVAQWRVERKEVRATKSSRA
jgi:hypothetical protein